MTTFDDCFYLGSQQAVIKLICRQNDVGFLSVRFPYVVVQLLSLGCWSHSLSVPLTEQNFDLVVKKTPRDTIYFSMAHFQYKILIFDQNDIFSYISPRNSNFTKNH